MIGAANTARKAACEAANAPKPRKTPALVNPIGRESAPPPGDVVQLKSRKHSVEAWLRAATTPGGELRGGEALRIFSALARGGIRP